MLSTRHFYCCGLGSIPFLGIEIPLQATACCGQEKKKEKKISWHLYAQGWGEGERKQCLRTKHKVSLT